MNAVTKHESHAVALSDSDMLGVLGSSLYPGASPHSISMVLQYCKAAGLDPMQKPVHIVPLWDGKKGEMRDVVMPGIGMYRVQASRSGQFAGMSEPEFGPDVKETIGGSEITYPAWCRVVIKRLLPSGHIAEFVAVERWKENYAIKGGKEKSVAPNAMWAKRPYGQLAKCAEAQALRKAFPEIGAEATAEEMEGKALDAEHEITSAKSNLTMPTAAPSGNVIDGATGEVTPGPEVAAAQPQTHKTDARVVGVGEKKYLEGKFKAKGVTQAEAMAACGLTDWENLTVDGFQALKEWVLA
jgi:phage recombination protein Bet